MGHAAVDTLERIKSTSKHAEYYAEHVTERLAQAWSQGEHKPKFRELKPGEEYTATELNAQQYAATGVTVAGCMDDFSDIGAAWRQLANDLSKQPNEQEMRQIYDAYDTGLDAYWRLLRTLRDAFKEKKGIIQYIGPTYRQLFQYNLDGLAHGGEKLVTLLSPTQNGEKLRDWTVRTQKYLRQGREYSQGKQPDPNDLM